MEPYSTRAGLPHSRRVAPWMETAAVWGAAYLAAGLVAVATAPDPGLSAWYPASAIGIALLLLHGRIWWPLLVACELVVSLAQYDDPLLALLAGLSTAAVQVALVTLLGRLRFDRHLDEPRDVVVLVGASALLYGLVALVAAPLARLVGFDPAPYWEMVAVWFVGGLSGVVVVLPVLLLVLGRPGGLGALGQVPGRRMAEKLTVTAGTLALVWWAFAGVRPQDGSNQVDVTAVLPFLLCLLPILWQAIRFGRARTALLVLAADVVGIVALLGWSHADVQATSADLLPVQVFIVVSAIAALLVATAVDAQTAARSRLQAVFDNSPVAIVTVDHDDVVTSWNPAAAQIFGLSTAEVVGTTATYDTSDRSPATEQSDGPGTRVLRARRPDGTEVVTRVATRRIPGSGTVALIEDVTAELEARQRADLLTTAIHQTTDLVVITDTDRRILYANPATEELSGYPLADLLGHRLDEFQPLTDADTFGEVLGRAISEGRWHGVTVNRTRDGRTFEADTTVAPVRDEQGHIVAVVAVAHDLTEERARASEAEDRLRITNAAADIGGDDLESIALALCDSTLEVGGLSGVAVFRDDPDGTICLLSSRPEEHLELLPSTLDAASAEGLRDMSRAGAWCIPVDDPNVAGGPHERSTAATGTTAIGGAPVRWHGTIPAYLLFVTGRPDGHEWLEQRLSAFAAVAAHAGPLLGPLLAEQDAAEAARARVRAILDGHEVTIAFQPIVDLTTLEPVGREALARFPDGTRPDVMFAEADRVGLRPELEMACVEAALRAVCDRGDGRWVSVNLSPDLLTRPGLHDLLDRVHCPVVLEITEHDAIADYGVLRGALEQLPGAQVAVDDAGAGFASLSHILELGPDLVKLDIALVRGIESDPARQAMVAGMHHFAEQTGTVLLAEGIETEAELGTLRSLGVQLGQGFLLGRPAPLA